MTETKKGVKIIKKKIRCINTIFMFMKTFLNYNVKIKETKLNKIKKLSETIRKEMMTNKVKLDMKQFETKI